MCVFIEVAYLRRRSDDERKRQESGYTLEHKLDSGGQACAVMTKVRSIPKLTLESRARLAAKGKLTDADATVSAEQMGLALLRTEFARVSRASNGARHLKEAMVCVVLELV